MKKIGLITFYNNYNYGSSLQAYVLTELLKDEDYLPIILQLEKNGLEHIIRKAFRIIEFLVKGIIHKDIIKQFFVFKNMKNEVPENLKKYFEEFNVQYFKIERFSYSKLKKIGRDENYFAFICGSDQIWGFSNPYLPPINYLRFAPKYKRITYAPSFGVSEIPKYRKKNLTRYLNGFTQISIREQSGAKIIKDLTGKDAFFALDPTLLVNKEFWVNKAEPQNLKKKYILCYFLNEPSEKALEYINDVKTSMEIDVLYLPYQYNKLKDIGEYLEVTPFGFVDLINNASVMLTDSFHGVAFAINLNIPFFVFDRQYGHSYNQSARVSSILNITQLEDRWIDETKAYNKIMLGMDFNNANSILEIERKKSMNYLLNSLNKVRENNNELL